MDMTLRMFPNIELTIVWMDVVKNVKKKVVKNMTLITFPTTDHSIVSLSQRQRKRKDKMKKLT